MDNNSTMQSALSAEVEITGAIKTSGSIRRATIEDWTVQASDRRTRPRPSPTSPTTALAPATVIIAVRCASPAAIAAIPTLTEWGLLLLAILLALGAWWRGPMMRTGRW